MMRLAVRVAFGLGIMLSASSMAAAQVVPGAMPNSRDPLLSRAFSRLTFDGTKVASGPVSRPLGTMDLLLAPHGGRLPEITAAPEAHGVVVPCTMRVVRVDPKLMSNMPVVSVDQRADPKSVIKVVCEPRD
jgi:hypothetical protein